MTKYEEKELRSAAITIIDEYGQINTSDLSKALRERLNPSGHDLEILAKRTDDVFSQKVRNLVSHWKESNSIANFVNIDQTVRPALFISRRFEKSISGVNEIEKKKILVKRAKKARSFTGRYVDFESYQRENTEIGLAGELFFLELETENVRQRFGEELASQIIHSSRKDGDGTGYDILSFDDHGIKHIEVKTTKNKLTSAFYMSYNEKAFLDQHIDTYFLVRIYDFNKTTHTGKYEIYPGSVINTTFDFSTQSYRVTFR